MSLADTITLASMNGRVCPMLQQWNHIYALLPACRRSGAGNVWEPELPLILGAWHETTDNQKASRLRIHLEWADTHGALETIHAFLEVQPEGNWLHHGE